MPPLVALHLGCGGSRAHPFSAGLELVEYRAGRPALGLAERRRKRKREAFLLLRSEEAGDRKPPPMRNQEQPLDAEFRMHDPVKLYPERIERPLADAAAVAHLAHGELGRGDGYLLVGLGAAIAHLEGAIDQQNVEPAEAEHRPRAGQEEGRAGREADETQHHHQYQEALAAERAVRGEHRRKDRGFLGPVVVRWHAPHYTGTMARKTPRRVARKVARKVPRRTAQNLRAARGSKAKLKGPRKRVAADKKAAAGALPQWTQSEIEEAFRRFQAAMPEPRGELKHINPFTLLVAVVLSAQATDAGVNKATPALFAAADTPEKMVALGEARVRDLIKTIRLYRTKPRTVIRLSEILVADHGGMVPPLREALEALPGVGRKTANVVLNIAFGEPTIAVDTHIFRVGNRTALAPRKTPLEVEMNLEKVVPPPYKLHAHHWLILHGRYTCVARRPLCETCLINDLCRWPEKTV